MPRLCLAAALVLVLAGVPAAAGGDDLAQNAVNNPADSFGIWGTDKVEILTDAKVPGGVAKRVTIAPKPANPWDAGGYVVITKPVRKGDVLLLAFWARAVTPPPGDDFIEMYGRIYETAPPQTSVSPETTFLIGKEWKLHYASGTADKDYPVGKLSCGVVLATAEQTIEFGPATITDYGPGYDLTKLPAE